MNEHQGPMICITPEYISLSGVLTTRAECEWFIRAITAAAKLLPDENTVLAGFKAQPTMRGVKWWRQSINRGIRRELGLRVVSK